jgi:GxxExxY protein
MKLLFEDLTYKIIGCCFEVHKALGKGFSEVVYKDALTIEFDNKKIPFHRELRYKISYKGMVLPHFYIADFVIDKKIILEIKAIESLSSSNIKQTLNYLAASDLRIALLINFGEVSLKYKRIIL